MRVTNRYLYYQLLKDIGNNTEKLFKLNSQISSGKRIQKPSDDPLGMGEVLNYRTELTALEQHQRTIAYAGGWLDMMDSMLTQTDDLLARTLELATQQASATASAETRENAACEIENIRTMVISLANSKYGNKYMCGGTQTRDQSFLNISVEDWQENVLAISSSPPSLPQEGDRYIDSDDNHIYAYESGVWQDQEEPEAGTAVVVEEDADLYIYNSEHWVKQYQGNDSSSSLKITKNNTIDISIPGSEIFRNENGDIVMTLLRLEKALRENDQDGVRNEIAQIENCSTIVLNNLAIVGSKTNQLDHTRAILEKNDINIQERLSRVEDLDYAEAITSLQNQQTVYEATLKSAAMITGLSLVDYV
ncbi:MAG: flagellar hook-associated protein FlgL [Deltaproteobacteria bacterium]|nr:flagellar hook-associated protein FlgL [Deltaproteobacteria bacterium]